MGLCTRFTFVWLAILASGVSAVKVTQGSRINQPDASVNVSPFDLASVVKFSPSDLADFVRELRLENEAKLSSIEDAGSIPIAVMPNAGEDKEGVGSILQHYRKSLSYALALGLPWVGRIVNEHDHIDYTEFLGLCQPFCNWDFADFDSVHVSVSEQDLDECEMNGTFKVPQDSKRSSLILIDDGDLDQGHTNCLTRIRDRFLSTSMRSVACTKNYFETLHFRWGDVKTNDCDDPDGRGVNMSEAVELIKQVRQLCPLQVKVMSEGADVKECFSNRFSDTFEYIDGSQSNVPYDLLTFACSTVLIGGESSFSVLGSLLTDGLVIAPRDSVKYNSLHNVIDFKTAQSHDLAIALPKLAPCV